MNWWLKLGCFLTGWDKTLISQCSIASRTQLSKYTSALMILMLIWGVTGFCFAQRYIELPLWGCLAVALAFITIIIMVERQIILTLEKSWKIVAFRFIIAFVMAIVGSTIFDQTMFGKDINKQMEDTIEEQVAELTTKRVHILDEKLVSIKTEIDSIELVNSDFQKDINKNPFVKQVSVTTTKETIILDNGKIKNVNKPMRTVEDIPNPKIELLKGNNEKLYTLKTLEQRFTQDRLNMENDVRAECKEDVGFLEELEAMWTIISDRPVARIFYIIFFVLLLSLEMFVVVSKIADKECDYETTVKQAQELRIHRLNATFKPIKTA